MILITRPNSSAKKLQVAFEELGIDSYIKSLTSIVLNKKQYNFGVKDIYIVTSQYSVEFLKSQINLKKKLNNLKFLVIGNSTASKLTSIGARNILYLAENSDQLIKHIQRKKYSQNLTYICGSNRNKSFINNLEKNKKKLEYREAYKVLTHNTISKKVLAELEKGNIKVILIFSLVNAELFIKTSMKYELDLDKYIYICMSKKIAEFMKSNRCKNATYSSKSTLQAMIEKTQSILEKIQEIK